MNTLNTTRIRTNQMDDKTINRAFKLIACRLVRLPDEISDATAGMNQFCFEALIDLLPQVSDVYINQIRFTSEFVPPYFRQNLLACHYDTRMPDQKQEQVVFSWRKLNQLLISGHSSPLAINAESVQLIAFIGFRLLLLYPQQPTDTS